MTNGRLDGVLVDPEDEHVLREHRWRLAQVYPGYFYVMATIDGKTCYLHRMLMNPPGRSHVDHINGNGLDNRRANLRVATASQNQWNKRQSSNNSSGFKGVVRDKSSRLNPWRAQIKRTYIGKYPTAEEAARAYDQKAIELFGEFALTNEALGLFNRDEHDEAA